MLELYDQEPTYYGNRAACYLQMKKYSKCLEDCEMALKKEPNNSKFIRRKALSLINLGKISESKQLIQKQLEIDPTDKQLREDDNLINMVYYILILLDLKIFQSILRMYQQ